ncbi:MAG TPA: VanW family protein [Polyangiaceae bacterium]|nr:VanW family protein [Polyangiaceae bacterium]
MAEQNPEQPAAPNLAAKVNSASESAQKPALWVSSGRARQLVPLALVVVVVALVGAFGAEALLTRGLSTSHVTLAGSDVSRLGPASIEARVRALEGRLESRKLLVHVAGRSFELEPRSIGFRLDRKRTLERILSEGRKGGVLARFASFCRRATGAAALLPVVEFDRAELRKLVASWEEKALSLRPSPGGLRVEAGQVTADYPHGGRGVAQQVAVSRVLGALADPSLSAIDLPVVDVGAPVDRPRVDEVLAQARQLLAARFELAVADVEHPLVITPEQLGLALRTRQEGRKLVLEIDRQALESALQSARNAIEREPVDAKFQVDASDHPTILPSRSGLRIDFERLPAVLREAASGSRRAELPLRFEPSPKLSTEEAQNLGIKGLVSAFTTRHPCCERRVDNIHHIADLLDGLVVRPGETVSLNEVVGPRSEKNGFVPAPTIEEGEMVETPGGGISQFATTMFNALFHGGYDIIERQPHSYWFPRYPMGHEATLSWPKPDLIFRNDTAAGLLIKTAYTDKSITVKLYGDNGGRKVRAEVSQRMNVTEPPIELIANPALEPNREKVKASGAVGWSVIVSRMLTFPDGSTREEKRKVTYKPRARRVEVHPCRIPSGEKGYTGERCPEPRDAEMASDEPAP